MLLFRFYHPFITKMDTTIGCQHSRFNHGHKKGNKSRLRFVFFYSFYHLVGFYHVSLENI